VRAIHTAPQFDFERSEQRKIENIVTLCAENITNEVDGTASAPHWLAACTVARLQYARRRALAADLFEPDRLDSRRFAGLLIRESRRYELPELPGWPYEGAFVEPDMRNAIAMMLPGSLREDLVPVPASYVHRVVIETAQLAVAFNDETLFRIAQQRFFQLGNGLKTSARLAEYLHPYPTGPNSVSPQERLGRILATECPLLYVRQSYNDMHALRHGKMSKAEGTSGKRTRCEFSVEQILDGTEGVPTSLRQQAVRYLAVREDPAAFMLDPEARVMREVSLEFIKPLLPERDASSLQRLIDHAWERITDVLSHAEYVSLRRAVKKLPRVWSRDKLLAFAEAYLQRAKLHAASSDAVSAASEHELQAQTCPERDDSFRFDRAVLPFLGPPTDVSAYENLVQDRSRLAAIRLRRQSDFEREVRAIPSGRAHSEG
jgi:hypothetical protein